MFVSSSDEAQELAASLHRRFSSVLAKSPYAVTCSMGALIVPARNRHTCDELMRLADRLMDGAKHNGKNQAVIATAIPHKHLSHNAPHPQRAAVSIGRIAEA